MEELVTLFKTLPGVGRRSAERIVLSIQKWPAEKTKRLAVLLNEMPDRIGKCPECANFAMDGALCSICASPSRDPSIVCIVEDSSQIQNIENSGMFKGKYHVLGGKISPLQGRELSELNVPSLKERIQKGAIREVVMAFSFDIEGQATAACLAEILKDMNVKITRLARGLPVGSDISYVDSATIAAALSGRTGME